MVINVTLTLKNLLIKILQVYSKWRFYVIGAVFTAILLIAVNVLNLQSFFNAIELKLFDYRTRIHTQYAGEEPDPSICMIVYNDTTKHDITKYNLNIDRWPLPRRMWGYALSFLSRAQVNSISFDIQFPSVDSKYEDRIFEYWFSKSNITPEDKELITKYDDNFFSFWLEKNNKLFPCNTNIAVTGTINPDLINQFLFAIYNTNPNLITDVNNNKINPYKSSISNVKLNDKVKTGINRGFQSQLGDAYNLITEKFEYMPLMYLEKLNSKVYSNIIVSVLTPPNNNILKLTKEIGLINVQNTEDLTDVVRENKPVFMFNLSEYYLKSLSLSSITMLLKEKNISFENNFLTTNFIYNNRVFPLNKYGNMYLNWRKKDGKTGEYIIKTYPISKIFAYEFLETTDPKTGYNVTPDEQNLYWQSHYYDILDKPLDMLYYYYFIDNYSYIYFNENSDKSASINSRNPIEIRESILKIPNEYTLETLGLYRDGYFERLINIIKDDSHNPMYNFYLENYNNLDDKIFNYYMTSTDPDYAVYSPGYYSINPKVAGISIKELFIPYNGYILYNTNSKYGAHRDYNCLARNYFFKSNSLSWQKIGVETNYYRNSIINNIDKIGQYALKPIEIISNIVILGECTGGGDVHVNPLQNAFPGPEIVATAMDNYLNDGTPDNKLITVAPLWLNILVILASMLITIYAVLHSKDLTMGIIVIIALIVIYFCINITLFVVPHIRIWLNLIYPLLMILITSMGTITYKNVILDKDKNRIKSELGQFVSPQIMEKVLESSDSSSMKEPQKKEMTILFSDIRDFTTKSEEINPEKLIPQLNEYLSEMVEVIIMKYNGTLDKYMGDAIMAFWGDPIPMEDHAKRAVLTALTMKEHLIMLNKAWIQEGKIPFRIGIGINTGEVIVGRMGSPRLIDYTVIGDTVNVASRIEGLNKQFGTEILIGESTYNYVKDIIEANDLGTVNVKGKTEEIRVFEIIGLKENIDLDFEHSSSLFTKKVKEPD